MFSPILPSPFSLRLSASAFQTGIVPASPQVLHKTGYLFKSGAQTGKSAQCDEFESSMPQPSVLITAFEPFGEWRSNSSWQCLVQFTRDLPAEPKIVTRLYPVDFAEARLRLARDLTANFDMVLHLGQSTGRPLIELEMFGLNVGGIPGSEAAAFGPLEPDGPPAYRSDLPLHDWAAKLRLRGIPAQVSYHAGTYLCNAMLYWTHYLAERDGLPTRVAFVHVPLEPSQVVECGRHLPSLPSTMAATALRCLVSEISGELGRLA